MERLRARNIRRRAFSKNNKINQTTKETQKYFFKLLVVLKYMSSYIQVVKIKIS